MTLARRMKRLRKKSEEVTAGKKRRKVLMEPLEPRLLLSADLSFTMTGSAKDLTLKLDQIDGIDMVQLLNSEDTDPSTQVVASRALAETSTVEILGSEQDDVLRLGLDFNSLVDSLAITFRGGAGDDTLVGPSSDSTWHITGANAGTVTTVDFSGIENLTGAADNQDTFVFEEGGSLKGMIDGGAGGFDTLVMNGVYDTIIFSPTGPDSGSVDLDGNLITYSGLEPVNSGTATDVIFNLRDVDDDVVLQAVDVSTFRISGPGFETTDFGIPTGSLTINGGGGEDSVTVTTSISMPGADLTINAESITVNPGITVTADSISLTASATDDGTFDFSFTELLGLDLGFDLSSLDLSIDEILFANPSATIDLSGAALVGSNITLSSESSLDLRTMGFDLSSIGTGIAAIYAGSNAEVILDGTDITATGNLSISALSDVAASASRGSSSSSDASTDNALTITIVNSDAAATITGDSDISVAGTIGLSAANTVTASAIADASEGSGSAGGVLALAVVDQTTSAYIAGTTSIDAVSNEADSITIAAVSDSTVTTTAKSSPGGASQNAGGSNTESQLSRTDAGTSEGGIGVAAAVAITDLTSDTKAYVSTAGSTLVTTGNMDINATSANRSRATADGTATSADSAAVGVAVGINYSDIDSRAYIGGTPDLTANAVTAKATIEGREWEFDPSSAVDDTREEKTFDPSSVVSEENDTITITGHGFVTGDVVLYNTGSESDKAVGNLINGRVYYAIVVDADTLKLAKSYEDAKAETPVAIDLNTDETTGTAHKLTHFHDTINLGLAHGFKTGDAVVYDNGGGTSIGGLTDGETYYIIAVDPMKWTFDSSSGSIVNTTDETINLGSSHGFQTGDVVVYDNGDGSDIGGLDDGTTYYIIKADNTHVKLAETAKDAQAGTAIDLTSTGSGNHTLTEIASTRFRLASSSENAEKGIAIDLNAGAAAGDHHTFTEKSSSFIAEAASGASAPDSVGVAGSLALNIVTTNAEAYVVSGATVTLHNKALNLEASSKTQIIGKAMPKEAATGESVGVGASVALNIGDNVAKAEIQNLATVTGASDITLSAEGSHKMTTQAKGGAEGGIAITPVVAISLANNDTIAQVGTGVGALSLSGNLNATADHSSTVSTKAAGDTTSSGTAAIGASLAMSLIGDTALATTARSISAGTDGSGTIGFSATTSGSSKSDAKASAKGGQRASRRDPEDPEYDSTQPADVDEEAASQRTSDSGVDSRAASQGARDSSARGTSPSASSSGGPVTVAAAVSINLTDSTARAYIPDGVTINAAGALSVSSKNDASAWAAADGSAVKGDIGIGAAVSVNRADIVNEAYIGAAEVHAEGITLQTQETTKSVSFNSSTAVDDTRTVKTFNPLSTGVIDEGADTITITGHGFTRGDVVEYQKGADTNGVVGNLTSGTLYYVIVVDADKIKLATSFENATADTPTAIDINKTGTSGSSHKLILYQIKTFKPSTAVNGDSNAITITSHDLSTGDVVEYKTGSDTDKAVGGLSSGTVYYVIRIDDDTLKLAKSYEDAQAGIAIDINTDETTGAAHKLVNFHETITLSADHGLKTGDLVLYRKGTGDVVGGLKDGDVYYVMVDESNPNKVRLAKSTADASALKPVDLTKAATGSTNYLIRLNTYVAEATSGAGAKDVSVAGSLGLNIVNKRSEAFIKSGASIDADGTDANTTGAAVTISAVNTAIDVAVANSTVTGKGDVGVGASVALNLDDTVTRAEIEDSAVLTHAANLSLTATTTPAANTKAEAGTAGDVSIGGAVAITMADAETIARVGTGTSTTLTGTLTVDAAEED
jgi:hypothetical protein